MPINILVTAVGGGVGQSVLRALKCSNLDYRVIGTDIDPWAAGLYSCDKGYIVCPAGNENYKESIIDICKKEKINVVIPGSDPELPLLAELAPFLLEMGVVSILGNSESVQICRDKRKTYKFFAPLNLPFIKTFSLHDSNDCNAINTDDFPLIIKPASGSASQDVHIAFCDDDLESFRKENSIDYIVQEYLIPQSWDVNKSGIKSINLKNEGRLVQKDEISVQILLDLDGTPFSAFTSINSLKDGVPSTINPIAGSEAEKIAWEMGHALGKAGLRGPCNFQCRHTDKGPNFFEVNPRFTGITAVRARAGFNEVEALIRLFYFHHKIEDIKASLKPDYDVMCNRYITEYYLSRQDYESVIDNKVIEAPDKGYGCNI